MKKILMLATAAFLFTGVAFAHGGDKKKCAKGKECCKTNATTKKEECKNSTKECCKKGAKTTEAKKA